MRRTATLILLGTLGFAPTARAADEIHWTFTGPTSVTLDWRGADSTLAYGFGVPYDSVAIAAHPDSVPVSSPGPFWEARLTGLLENTTYHYAIGAGDDHRFHTPPVSPTTFTVLVESDIGASSHYPRTAIVQSLVASAEPAFVLAVGDLTYGDDYGPAAVDQHFNDVMAWSQDAAYMPAWGNHEWPLSDSLDSMRNYKGRFDLPNPQASPNAPVAGCCGEDWYWFDYGQVRFIGYPEPYRTAWTNWGGRAAAIMDDAQNDPAIRYIVTFGHRPAYSSGYHAGDATLRAIMDGLGSTHSKYVLNVNGHSHDYERSFPQHGVTHVTAGIGGSSLEEAKGICIWPGGCPAPVWSAFRAYHHGALKLVFGPSSIRGEALCGPPGDAGTNLNDITCALGETFDSFAIGQGVFVLHPPRRYADRFALQSAHAAPRGRAIEVEYALDGDGPAGLELVDVAGRIVLRRDLGTPGAGARRATLEAGRRIPPGVYLVRLTEADRSTAIKVALVR